MKFTLDQLKYAQEVCFRGTFMALWVKHSDEPQLAYYMASELGRKGGLLPLIFMYSRKDYETSLGRTFDRILSELIGDYGKRENDVGRTIGSKS